MTTSIQRALISVSDKTGLVEFAKHLVEFNIELLSTGGSASLLRENNIPVVEVADYTGFPEIMDGRVKTLQPKIHGGLLAVRDEPSHQEAMEKHHIWPIDLLVVNLYPFEATVAKGADYAECIENIDVGGPAMIRAASKNYKYVTVVVDPEDYVHVLNELKINGGYVKEPVRKEFALKAFTHTAAYDAAIANYLSASLDKPTYPASLVLTATLHSRPRYGENPHQNAAFYVTKNPPAGVATAVQIQGKELSYNNLADTDAAYELVSEFEKPAVAIIKHANPCGVAVADSIFEAYKKALACDPISAFGGVIALNQPLDEAVAEEISKMFVEVVIAPQISEKAKEVLSKKKNVRVLEAGSVPDPNQEGTMIKSVSGGYLIQSRDNISVPEDMEVVTTKKPTTAEMEDLDIAFKVCKHVKSNAIIFVKNGATVGIGAGQMSRLDSANIAAVKADEARHKAGETASRTEGAVAASDAFFPFPDALFNIAMAGATAVIQPGGSIRDEEIINTANQMGIAMVLTGVRHFKH